MRTFTVFYSWQSDTPSPVGRTFVAKALEDAAKIIRSTRQIAVQIDADTQGVPGTPAVSETILRKIDACDAVLADLTLVSSTAQGKTAPNPNVLIEYGYALKAKGQSHVLLVMNTAFGGPEGLPFDLRHLRHPMQFEAPQALSDAARRERRSRFAEKLVVAINTVIDAPRPRGQKTTRPANEQAEGLKRLQERQATRISHGLGVVVRRPRVVIDVFPLAALGTERLDLRTVKAARPWFAPADGGVEERQTQQNEWLSLGPGSPNGNLPNFERHWATRLLVPGHVERVFAVSRETNLRAEVTQDGATLDKKIVSGLRRSGELLFAIGLGGEAIAALGLEGCEDLRLIFGDGTGRPIGRNFAAFRPITIDDPRSPTPTELRPLLDDLWQAAGWEDGTPSIDDAGWVEARKES